MKLPFVVDGDGSGPKLVFAHGLMGTGAIQRSQMQPLVDAGWTVATFDQRGHADAPPIHDASDNDPVAMGDDLWEVADAAGFDRCWIGGGSMGAATSWCAARSRPERVEGLIQAVPALRDEPHPAIFMFDALAGIVAESGNAGAVATLRKLSEDAGAPVDEMFLEQLMRHDTKSLETALRSVPRWVLDDVPGGFADVPFPVIVTGWDDDPIHPLQTAKDIAAAAQVELVVTDMAIAREDPSRFGRLLADAIAGTVRALSTYRI
ncbi:MAG: alpha/beta fold hydrolase [Actinomycetota bacterium]